MAQHAASMTGLYLGLLPVGLQGGNGLAVLLLLLLPGSRLCLQRPQPVCVLLRAAASCLQPGFKRRRVHHAQLLLQLQQPALLFLHLHLKETLSRLWSLHSDGHSNTLSVVFKIVKQRG